MRIRGENRGTAAGEARSAASKKSRVILSGAPLRAAKGAESKDPVGFTSDILREFHGILRLRYARVSTSAPLRMTRLFFVKALRALVSRSRRPRYCRFASAATSFFIIALTRCFAR